MGFINGLMDLYMMDNGLRERFKEKVLISIVMGEFMMVIGNKI